MANSFSSNPMVLDTDFASYRSAASVSRGIRVTKMMLCVGSGSSSAGSVSITEPANSNQLYPPVPVAASTAANTNILNENPTGQAVLAWPDFAVSGLTATGTKLYVWFGI